MDVVLFFYNFGDLSGTLWTLLSSVCDALIELSVLSFIEGYVLGKLSRLSSRK